MAKRQIAQMSKIKNDGLTRTGTGCVIAVPIWQHWASPSKVLNGNCFRQQMYLSLFIMN